jgi:hypothetical protein
VTDTHVMVAAIFAAATVAGSFAAAASPEAGASWRGTVIVDGMIHEPSGYHPYKTTIGVRLRESQRVAVAGGFRVPLVSDGSVYEVQTSVHQTDGPMLCSGTGTETLTGLTIGYVETKAGKATYHLALPRAFGAFACGRNHTTGADRWVVIGVGDLEAADIETADPLVRTLEAADSVMKGAFQSNKTRGAVRYQYSVSWSLTRAPAPR